LTFSTKWCILYTVVADNGQAISRVSWRTSSALEPAKEGAMKQLRECACGAVFALIPVMAYGFPHAWDAYPACRALLSETSREEIGRGL